MKSNEQQDALEVHDLTVNYEKKPVLWGVDFSLRPGTITGIVGPNGAGKSTLIKSIMGLIPLSSGYIKIFGEDLDHIRKRVSYVPQRGSVDWDFPASVMDVVLMGRYSNIGLFGRIRKADREIAEDALRKVEMFPYAKRQISELSGGQQQRVFLARALAQDADIYFMDEPFAGVDAATEKAILRLMKSMAAQNKTLVVVHHDLHSVREFFDWVILLNLRLIAYGPVATTFTEKNLQDAYGGKLSVLSEVGELVRRKAFPQRET